MQQIWLHNGTKYPEANVLSVSPNRAAHLQMYRDQQEEKTLMTREWSLQDVRHCLGGPAFGLSESRIGWGSCKLPKQSLSPSLHGTGYHHVPSMFGSYIRVDADPSSTWVTSWTSTPVVPYKSCRADIRREKQDLQNLRCIWWWRQNPAWFFFLLKDWFYFQGYGLNAVYQLLKWLAQDISSIAQQTGGNARILS